MVKEMVIYKGSLYWSTIDNSLDKESRSRDGQFYRSTIESNLQIDSLVLMHPSGQAMPRLLDGGRVQALNLVMGHREGVAKWSPPISAVICNDRVYSNWTYTIQVTTDQGKRQALFLHTFFGGIFRTLLHA